MMLTVTYGPTSIAITLVLNAWPALSPGESPHIAHAFASRGIAKAHAVSVAATNPDFRILSDLIVNSIARLYIRYTSTNSTGQTAHTKYQYIAHNSTPAALRAL